MGLLFLTVGQFCISDWPSLCPHAAIRNKHRQASIPFRASGPTAAYAHWPASTGHAGESQSGIEFLPAQDPGVCPLPAGGDSGIILETE